MKRQFVYTLFLLCAASACVVDEADLSRYSGAGTENMEEAHNVEVNYTDSTYTVFILKAPVSRRVYKKATVTEVFPEGISEFS